MRKLILALMVMMAFCVSAQAQRTVSGRVTDADGKPISNVSVLVRGTTTGTTTDANGNYTIQVTANGRILEFSSLGFEGQSISIGNSSLVSPILTSTEAKDLQEVVVTGYQRVRRSQYSGAASKIGEKELKNQPVGSFEQVFQGRVPGVTAITGSGQPGQASTIIIRGQNSIAGNSAPLYVVDGIPVEEGVFQGLNPNDFASVDILRDATAAAAYGSRGSAGVVVVTTKRGTSGKIKLNYIGQMGVISKPDFAFRPMTTAELLSAQDRYGVVVAGGNAAAPAANDPDLPGFFYSPNNPRYAGLSDAEKAENARLLDSIRGINTNWADEIFRNANFSRHQLTLSGGTGRTRLFSSVELYNEEGITLRTDMKRVSVRNNIDYADDKVTFAVSSNLAYVRRNFQQTTVSNNLGNPFLSSAVNVPYARVRNDDGSYATGIGAKYSAANQLDITALDKNYTDQFKGTLSFSAGYKITRDINLSLVAGIDFRESQNTNYGDKRAFIRRSSTSITGQAGFQSESLDRWLTGTVRPTLNYRRTFRERHDVNVSVFGEYIKEHSKFFTMTGFGTDPRRPNTPAAITQGNAVNQLFAQVGGSKGRSALLSGVLLASYTLDGKYTLQGSYRQDGSSKLPKETRWQDFYSIGGTWEASKEEFIRNIRFINTLRLKLSYGTSGNSNNFPGGFYPYQATWAEGGYSGLVTIVPTDPGYKDLMWETTSTLNFGIDFEVLNRRIYGDINLYNRVTTDLFVDYTLPAENGWGLGYGQERNNGKLSNKGVEVNISGDVLRSKDWLLTLNANFAYNKNEVVSLGGVNAYEVGTSLISEGLPLGSHYEVRWGGVDAATGQPLYYDRNGNLTNVYSADDRVQTHGTWEAPWRGGFGATARYKGFDLNVLFSWQSGSTKVDNMEFFLENPAQFLAAGYNQSSDLNFWTKPGDVTSSPSPLYGTDFSSKIIHDASFMRLREVRLGYTLPQNLISRMKYVSGVNVFVQGNNLFIWTNWRGMDPEAGAVNINLSEFPNPRRITAGLDITF